MRDQGDGLAGMRGLEMRQALAMERADLVPREGIRRQMVPFARNGEPGPVTNAFSSVLGLGMQLLIRRSTRTHNHPDSVPMPCEEYLQQWDAMAVGGRTSDGGADARGWQGGRPKKRQKAGFRFWTRTQQEAIEVSVAHN